MKEIRMEDKKAEEEEPEAPVKRSKPVQPTPAPEPAKKRQKPEPKKPKNTVVEKIDETESEESGKVPQKRTTPKLPAQKAE